MGQNPDISVFRATIVRAFPELSDGRFSFLQSGWHSTAVDVDDRLVFKFPRDAAAETALRREVALLAVIRPALTMTVPDLTLHPGPPVFSRHLKLKGGHLLNAHYSRMPESARQRLAEELALFHAELHGLEPAALRRAGAIEIEGWMSKEEIRAMAMPVLPTELRSLAERTLTAWGKLGPDPCGTVFGFFDGHGWNMAFDHARQWLNGIYDFADSGLGPLHQDFIYSGFIAHDLTQRIVTEYEALTGRRLDRRRITLLTGVHRLSELAELAHDPAHRPAMIANVAAWAATQPRI